MSTLLINFSCMQIDTYIGNVTTEIVKNVVQIQKLGVKKELVNNMHPIGCTLLRTSLNNYHM